MSPLKVQKNEKQSILDGLLQKALYDERNLLERFLFSFVFFGFGLATNFLLYETTGYYFQSVNVLFVLLIVICSGLLPAIFFTVILSLTNDYFFIEPIGSVLDSLLSVEHFFINSVIAFLSIFIFSALRKSNKALIISKNKAEKAQQESLLAMIESDRANSLKSTFLATISHEIRTPLNGIIGLSDVLRKMNLKDEELRFIELIHNSGKTLLKIVNDILDYSKIESGKIELEEADFSIQAIIEQVTSILDPKAKEKGIRLEFFIDTEVPKTLNGDSSRISQVLFNLLGNAIKFTSSGSVTIMVTLDPVEIDKNLRLNFSVTDTGHGLTLEQQEKIFQPFSSLQRTGTSGEVGTGLGLSICRQILRAMNSEIYVQSSQNLGSKFYFSLKFLRYSDIKIGIPTPTDREVQFRRQEVTQQIFDATERPMILAVEDNPTNQVTIQIMLERLGAQVIIASNGKESLDLVSKTDVDLILMDCQMPIMNGFEATSLLRKSRITVPIIAMTANVSKNDQDACLAAGMNGFLGKPLTIDAIESELTKFLKPEPALVSEEILKKLELAIGQTGKAKVIQAFLKGTDELKVKIKHLVLQKDLINLKQLGHRYKSSSDTVGARGLAYLFKKLEKSDSIEKAEILTSQIEAVIHEVESKLRQHA